jgi:hypothetical protein
VQADNAKERLREVRKELKKRADDEKQAADQQLQVSMWNARPA